MINIPFGSLFPWPFRLIAALVIFVAVITLPSQPWIALILSVGALAVLTSKEGTEFNVETKTYREYTSWFFLKTGSFTPYASVEKIFINRGKESRTVHSALANHSATYENVIYDAYVKFSSGEKIHLQQQKDKTRLNRNLASLCTSLNMKVEDNS